MALRNLIFESEIVEQRLRAGLTSHHEQQASEHGDRQQYQELWPAYNVIVASEQASSEGLFQQTQAIPLSISNCESELRFVPAMKKLRI